jgi:hypothetical protein
MFLLLEILRLFCTLLCVTETVRRDVIFRYACSCILRTVCVVRGFGCCSCLWTVQCAVDSALCCGQCTVLWTVHCAVGSALCCRQCTVLWTVHCAIHSVLRRFGSVSSFVKLTTACLILWLRKRGVVLLRHPLAFMKCPGIALIQLKLALLLTKCPVSLMISSVCRRFFPHVSTVLGLALGFVGNFEGKI